MITTVENFNVDNVSKDFMYKNIHDRGGNISMYPIRYGEDNKDLRLELPDGASCFVGFCSEIPSHIGGPDGRYNIPMSLTSNIEGEQKKFNHLVTHLASLDNFIIDYVTQRSEELFGEVCDREIIRERYSPLVKRNKNYQTGGKYPPSIKPKVRSSKDGEIQLYAYSTEISKKQPKTVGEFKKYIPPFCSATGVIKPSLWFSRIGKRFGLNCTLTNIKVIG